MKKVLVAIVIFFATNCQARSVESIIETCRTIGEFAKVTMDNRIDGVPFDKALVDSGSIAPRQAKVLNQIVIKAYNVDLSKTHYTGEQFGEQVKLDCITSMMR